MSELITCPDCERELRVPEDFMGRKVKCPSCGVAFTAEADGGGGRKKRRSSSSAIKDELDDLPRNKRRADSEDDMPRSRRRRRDEEEDEDYPRSARGRGRRDDYEEDDYDDYDDRPRRQSSGSKEGWRAVRRGITLYIIGCWAWVATLLIVIIGSVFVFFMAANTAVNTAVTTGTPGGAAAGAATAGTMMIIWIVFIELLQIASSGTLGAGNAFCLGVPSVRDAPLKPLAIVALAGMGGGTLLWLLGDIVTWIAIDNAFSNPFMNPFAGGIAVGPIMKMLAIVGMHAGWIVFFFFLKSCCTVLRKHDLAKTLGIYAIACICFDAATVLIYSVMYALGVSGGLSAIGSPAAARTAGVMMCGFMCTLILTFIGLFIWGFILLHQARSAVDSGARQRRR